MEQYISKTALVAEIERRKHKLLDNIMFEHDKEWVVRTAHQLNRIIMFLDTLEVKEVDIEKEIKNEIDEYWFDNDYGAIQRRGGTITMEVSDVKDIAKHFFELGLKAQKDPEFTWEGIKIILDIENDILRECNSQKELVIETYPKGEDYYGEILKRFKAHKGEENGEGDS